MVSVTTNIELDITMPKSLESVVLADLLDAVLKELSIREMEIDGNAVLLYIYTETRPRPLVVRIEKSGSESTGLIKVSIEDTRVSDPVARKVMSIVYTVASVADLVDTARTRVSDVRYVPTTRITKTLDEISEIEEKARSIPQNYAPRLRSMLESTLSILRNKMEKHGHQPA